MNNDPSVPDPLSAAEAVKAESPVAPPEEAGASVAGEIRAVSHGNLIPGVGRFRWKICALLFFATTINYIDRSVFGLLAPMLGQGKETKQIYQSVQLLTLPTT